MKLQNLTVIFIIIILPIILMMSLYINTGLKTIKYQTLYDEGLLTATHDAIYAFELNTNNDEYAGNPEVKRDILKASVKMFETSLCNTCNISTYNTSEIEEYIPAIVFGLYDGFYMYAPSYNPSNGKYEHSLKNYVYYSENLDDEGTTIRYSLDNYVVVSGDFGEGYETKEGFLIDLNGANSEGTKYKEITIAKETIDGKENNDAINYYKEAYEFTSWFNQKIGNKIKDKNGKYLYITSINDPENPNSVFVQHKREVIKNKIESVLNSSITAYSKRLGGYNYKMPKFSENDWQKIYTNISVITFFQGKNIGFTKYNGYCVLNSTNSNEYVNPDLMYFVDDNNYYHDIRCTEYESDSLTGYKIGSFQKRRVEQTDETTGETKTDANGNTLYEYVYNRKELACYNCINGSLETGSSVYDYVRGDDATATEKESYFTALARERYNVIKYK